jgi:hypothetical protein
MVKEPPGYHERKRIHEHLPKLSPRQRSAFAAACAEHVLPVLEKYQGPGSPCVRAIDVAWQFAGGLQPDAMELERIAADCEGLVAELYEADETGATLRAANAAIFALESVRKPESSIAEDAASEAQGAADSDAGAAGDAYIQEEADWQIRALDLVSSAATLTRDLLRDIAGTPRWLEMLEMR